MDENIELKDPPTDLLLQKSYNEGIQRLAGEEMIQLGDFQLPPDLMEKRKKAWDSLFEKYSSNVSQVEINILTLQQDKGQFDAKTEERRLPMRKTMSVVQHWVNTGALPYAENYNGDKSHSDTGSSLDEELVKSKSNPSLHSPCLIVSSSLDKRSESSERTLLNQHLKIASSSDSSVDTAAYILANNKTTKKADTVASIENSRCNRKKFSTANYKSSSCLVSATKQTGVITVGQMSIKETSDKGKISNQKDSPIKIKISNVNEDLECDTGIKNNGNADEKSRQNIKTCLQYGSSDESSIIVKAHNILESTNLQQSCNEKLDRTLCKQATFGVIKRKKLYNYTESPVELTPASEDNFSLKSRKKVAIKKCKHPALETPKASSRISYQVRRKQMRYRKKRNSRLLSFVKLNKQKENESLPDKPDCESSGSDDCILGNLFNEKIAVKETTFESNESKLKPLTVVLHKLPHTYAESQNELDINLKKCTDNQVLNSIEEHSKNCRNLEKKICKLDTTLDDKFFASVDKLFFNPAKKGAGYKSFVDVQSDGNVKFVELELSTVNTTSAKQEQTAGTVTIHGLYKSNESNVGKENIKRSMEKASKYTVVISSSDESEDLNVNKNHKQSKRVKSNSGKSKDHRMSKPLVVNSRDPLNYIDAGESVKSKFNTGKKDQLTKVLPLIKTLTTKNVQPDSLKIKTNESSDAPNKSTEKCKTASDTGRRKRKNSILLDDSTDEDNVLISSTKSFRFKRFEPQNGESNLKTASDCNEKRKINWFTNGLIVGRNSVSKEKCEKLNNSEEKIVNVKNRLSNDTLFDVQNLDEASNKNLKFSTCQENSSSLSIFKNPDEKQNYAKDKKFKSNIFGEHEEIVKLEKNSSALEEENASDVANAKFVTQSKNYKGKKKKLSLVKEKCARVSISSDEECIVPLKL